MFYDRLEKLCFAHGYTVTMACQLAGMHRATPGVWKAGHRPSMRSVIAMAKLLDTTVEYLLEGVSPEDGKKYIPLDEYTSLLWDEIAKMSEDSKAELLSRARELVSSQSSNAVGF